MPSTDLLLILAITAALGAAFWFYYRRTQILRRRLAEANQELEQVQRTFNRFAPSRVVDSVLEHESLDIAESREVTMLFADLRGFTALSEQMEAADLVKLLNTYFQRMDEAADAHSGFVSKFIGDGLLVLFGALYHNPWQSTDAVQAALQMHREVDALDKQLDDPSLPTLHLSIGIHRGPVVAGIMGSLEVKEFTVIGRHVNLAARIEELTRTHDADILISNTVKNDLAPSIVTEERPPCRVNGMAEPVLTHAVPVASNAADGDRTYA